MPLKKIIDPGAEYLLPRALKELAKLKTTTKPSEGLVVSSNKLEDDNGTIEVRTHNVFGTHHDYVRLKYKNLPFYCLAYSVQRNENDEFDSPVVDVISINNVLTHRIWIEAKYLNYTSERSKTGGGVILDPVQGGNAIDVVAASDGNTFLGVEYLNKTWGPINQSQSNGMRFTLYKTDNKTKRVKYLGAIEIPGVQKQFKSPLPFDGNRFFFYGDPVYKVYVINIHYGGDGLSASFSVDTLALDFITPDGPFSFDTSIGLPFGPGGVMMAPDKNLNYLYAQGAIVNTAPAYQEAVIVRYNLSTLGYEIIWRSRDQAPPEGYSYVFDSLNLRSFWMFFPAVAESGDVWFTTAVGIKDGADHQFYGYEVWKNNTLKYSFVYDPLIYAYQFDLHENPYGFVSADGNRFIDLAYKTIIGDPNVAAPRLYPRYIEIIDTDKKIPISIVGYGGLYIPSYTHTSQFPTVINDDIAIIGLRILEDVYDNNGTLYLLTIKNGQVFATKQGDRSFYGAYDGFSGTFKAETPDKNKILTFFHRDTSTRGWVKGSYVTNQQGFYTTQIDQTYSGVTSNIDVVFRNVPYI